MFSNRLTRIVLAAGVANLLLLPIGSAVVIAGDSAKDTSSKPKTYKPLPEDVIAAWKKAGFQAGWMRMSRGLFWKFLSEPQREQVKPTDLPAFQIKGRWPSTDVAKLPAPPTAFGLFFSSTTPNRKQAQQLARFKQLEVVYLFTSVVKDADVRSLSSLTSLKHLNIAGAFALTDAGLKSISKLKKLQTLTLMNPANITDAGLKHLAGLNKLRALTLWNTRQTTPAGVTRLQQALPKSKIRNSSAF